MQQASVKTTSASAGGPLPSVRQLLTVAALVEWLAGLGLVLAPGAVVALLLGVAPDLGGLMIGRVAGVALLALGVACWGARADLGGAAWAGTLAAITVYNAGAGLLLLLFAVTGKASGVGVWGAGVLHLVLATGFAATLQRPGDPSPGRLRQRRSG